ncbi:MAG TPA: hypothetical protein VGF54_19315 [Streptosporangiaceae bacterium]|jgi:hypothetical protein
MVSPRLIARYLRRKAARLIYLARGVDQDTQQLYGPNPNDISHEEKMRRMRLPHLS